jgi:hypothetical protein
MAVSMLVAVGEMAGPLVAAIERRLASIKAAPGLDEGADMVRSSHRHIERGWPAAAYDDEIFGPVLCVTRALSGRRLTDPSEAPPRLAGPPEIGDLAPVSS